MEIKKGKAEAKSVILVAAGSNSGNRLAFLQFAEKQLDAKIGPCVCKSIVYESAPWGGIAQENYLNQVFVFTLQLSAIEILNILLEIELLAGRQRTSEKFGPRTLDLDLILFGTEVFTDENLCIPHPRAHLRRFVVEPALEVLGDVTWPGTTKNISDFIPLLDLADWLKPYKPLSNNATI
jgi:2-amino-4-hydroxy-6-hydroxymethyldihydropteridine diphosphokinase